MAKFDPLGEFLRAETDCEFDLSFARIEEIIQSPLPPSARNRNYWGNFSDEKVNGGKHRSWLNAGYMAYLVNDVDRVQFRRIESPTFKRYKR